MGAALSKNDVPKWTCETFLQLCQVKYENKGFYEIPIASVFELFSLASAIVFLFLLGFFFLKKKGFLS